jgi:hypothetical protein
VEKLLNRVEMLVSAMNWAVTTRVPCTLLRAQIAEMPVQSPLQREKLKPLLAVAKQVLL